MLIKNQYGFYVLEGIILKCEDQNVVNSMVNEIQRGLTALIGNLDQDWQS